MDFISLSFVYSTLCLVIILIILKKLFQQEPPKLGKHAPSPRKLPIIGHLHLLAKFPDNPWQGFDLIRKQYGDVVSVQLGSYNAMLVSSLDKMKEVLITKGKIFSDRPDFYRYHYIFGGDRENALALCDWTELQKTRRVLCSISTTPKFASASYEMLEKAIASEIKLFFDFIETNPERVLTKSWLSQFSSNVFTEYLCEARMEYNDPILVKLSYFFDFIFNDISQCGPVDFLPFIRHLGFYRGYLKKLGQISTDLRVFVEKCYIEPRISKIQKTMDLDGEIDFDSFDSMISLDLMYKYHLKNPDEFNYEHFLFAIGDLIGGSSAIVNMVMRLLGHLSIDEEIQEDMYQDIAAVAKQHDTDFISLKHRPDLPLVEAAILEALRISSSPLVPHVPTEDTTIGGYFVPKGTIVLFNNHNMNFSTEFYTNPLEFQPSRFLSYPTNNNHQSKWQIKKPEVFLPFSIGQRSCLGFKLTQYITFAAISNILLRYKIEPVDPIETIKDHIRGGVLALRVDDIFRVKLIPRN